MSDARYRTLISGVLEQKTGLSVGGRNPPSIADSIFAVNGQGEPRIRGTAIAGALIASLRLLYGSRLPQSITYGAGADDDFFRDSAWRVYNSELSGAESNSSSGHFRSGVAILHKTAAAAEGALFEIEFLPTGTLWKFLIEIDETLYPNTTRPLAYAAHALQYWRDSGGLLGRDVARGMGWIRFHPHQVYRLQPRDITQWPDATKKVDEILTNLPERAISFDELLAMEEVIAHRYENAIPVRKGKITIKIENSESEDYGLDSLSLGNSELSRPLQQWEQQPRIQPLGMKSEAYAEYLSGSDLTFSWTENADSQAGTVSRRPYIPGSSIRGPLRHAWSWWLRRQGNAVWDPASVIQDPEFDIDPVAAIFGSKAQSARFLISDAALENDDYDFLLLEQHAGDEFTGGVFASGKFNRLCLLRGTFTCDFLFEYDRREPEILQQFEESIRIVGNLGDNRMLPLGGGKYRGHGWVKWSIELDPHPSEKTVDIAFDSDEVSGWPEEILQRLLASDQYRNPAWSWFEPSPACFVNPPQTAVPNLHPLLKKGVPGIPPGVHADEIKLFWPHQALFLQRIGDNRCRLFFWRITAESGVFKRKTSRVLIKQGTIWNQYGLGSEAAYPRTMIIDRYYSGTECVAWTLIGSQDEGESDAESEAREERIPENDFREISGQENP